MWYVFDASGSQWDFSLFLNLLQVNITLSDINDNAPVWRDEPYLVNVVEMSPIDTDVVTVSITEDC